MFGLFGTPSAQRVSCNMDRQVAFLVLALLSKVWSASGAPPVVRADRNSEPEAKAKKYGGSWSGCSGRQRRLHLNDKRSLALTANLDKRLVPKKRICQTPRECT